MDRKFENDVRKKIVFVIYNKWRSVGGLFTLFPWITHFWAVVLDGNSFRRFLKFCRIFIQAGEPKKVAVISRILVEIQWYCINLIILLITEVIFALE